MNPFVESSADRLEKTMLRLLETNRELLQTNRKIYQTLEECKTILERTDKQQSNAPAIVDLTIRWSQFQGLLKRLPSLNEQAAICVKIMHPEWTVPISSPFILHRGLELFPNKQELHYKANEEYGAIYRQGLLNWGPQVPDTSSDEEDADGETYKEGDLLLFVKAVGASVFGIKESLPEKGDEATHTTTQIDSENYYKELNETLDDLRDSLAKNDHPTQPQTGKMEQDRGAVSSSSGCEQEKL